MPHDPKDGVTPERLSQILTPFYESDQARDVALALVNAIVATEAVMLDGSGPAVKQGVARMLLDFSFQLYGNPFWQRFAASLQPVLAMAVIARMDSYGHATTRTRGAAEQVAFLASRQAAVEVAVQVLFYEQGTKGVHTQSQNLRIALVREIGGV